MLYRERNMETDRFSIALLLDYYGGTLTEKQREYLDMYYNEDLSLSEIAEITGISRPGVHNIIRRSRQKLTELERSIGAAERFLGTREQLARIAALAEETGADRRLIDMLNEVADGI